MNSKKIRSNFLDFFKEKNHQIVSSAPMVLKNDPSLMFTNAGMNQFKEFFLGESISKHSRIADTQKCLRVSGKHNDLEEVGYDGHHHTMFEMLGNWSFGDYFKSEAIAWAWEFLTETCKINPDLLYATVFEGDKKDNLSPDEEAKVEWKNFLPPERILYGSVKDNFWEMGATGPCGPCSEIHIDMRTEEDRKKTPGKDLVNKDHPEVIEIWNLVFIQYNRLSDGSLESLPEKHVDTGMGFERLCRILQNKKSNYNTDIFSGIIKKIEAISNKTYNESEKQDIAMRVISDHIRAVMFAIADGQLPSNNKAGYVIRRILRRAVRYGFSYLNIKEPFLYKLVPTVSEIMDAYEELSTQKNLIEKVIKEEESAFLKTLELGINKFETYLQEHPGISEIDGKFAFELFDTYGFPIDLTQLMAKEKNIALDLSGFNTFLRAQKERSRNQAKIDRDDWIIVHEDKAEDFSGYDADETEANLLKYRTIKTKSKTLYQLVFDKTPFYPESGGQVGDTGIATAEGKNYKITDTRKENELIVHFTNEPPQNPDAGFKLRIDKEKRRNTEANHSATHLLHYALRQQLGEHVQQKGSLVDENHLRFDFTHFEKIGQEDLIKIESIVNSLIHKGLKRIEKRSVTTKEASEMGAIALFGEKYGEHVRVIGFGDSLELCGGTHVENTALIGQFRIISESAIASGVRRIEAITRNRAEKFVQKELSEFNQVKSIFKNKKNIKEAVEKLIQQNHQLQKEFEKYQREKALQKKEAIKQAIKNIGSVNFLAMEVNMDQNLIKDIAFQLKNEIENVYLLFASQQNNKVTLTLMISESLVQSKGWKANEIIQILAKEIRGGGGGQDFFATAGGSKPEGIKSAFQKAKAQIVYG